MTNKYDFLIDNYVENKVGIDTNFLEKALCNGLYNNIVELTDTEQMKNAGIGNETIKDENQLMRKDKIHWLDNKKGNTFEKAFLQHIENFIERLNSTCYTGINDYEFHYAIYEKGSYYKKHKDQFQNNNHRKFSLIHYLNNNWLENDGGQLMVYQNETPQKIQPNAQTAVFFKSDELEHEVIKANRNRMSITGWLKRS